MPHDLRHQLLDAAATVLLEQGHAGVTTRSIAQAAGCSEGSIYNHFATKEDLVASAVGECIARYPARIDELAASPGSGDIPTQLRSIAVPAMAFYRRIAPVFGGALDGVHEHATAVHDAGHGPWRQIERIAGWLRAEQERGRIHPDADPAAAATALLGACLFQAVVAVGWGEHLAPDDDVAVDRAVAAAWRGLAPS